KAVALSADPKRPVPERIELIDVLGEAHPAGCVAGLLKLLAAQEPEPIRRASLGALLSYKDDQSGDAVIRLLPQMAGELRETAESMLVSRKPWSMQLLAAVDAGQVDAKSLPHAT